MWEKAEKRRKEENKKQAALARKSFQATSMYPMVETHADENEELIIAIMKELGESLEMLGGKDASKKAAKKAEKLRKQVCVCVCV